MSLPAVVIVLGASKGIDRQHHLQLFMKNAAGIKNHLENIKTGCAESRKINKAFQMTATKLIIEV